MRAFNYIRPFGKMRPLRGLATYHDKHVVCEPIVRKAPTMLLRTLSPGALEPEALNLLQGIFDECLRKLMDVRGLSDPSELGGTQELIGKRIIGAAEAGILDREKLETLALDGL